MTTDVRAAIEAIGRGEIAVVVDDEDRENEGDLIMAAETATIEKVAFFLRHTSGVICAALPPDRLTRLGLPLMVERNEEAQGTAFTVTVDVAEGITTGISAGDRARTLVTLADRCTVADDLVRPGHVFPLRAMPLGVVQRAGHTEAAVDLAKLAGVEPVGVLSEVVTPDKAAMAGRRDLERLAHRHRLPMISVAELIAYRLRTETFVEWQSSARIPTRYGDFQCHAFRSVLDGTVHLALAKGTPEAEPTLVRVHSECVTGDVLGSQRCDCGPQLNDAMRLIAQAGSGVLVYHRGHEGRGIGITQKLRAYSLQEQGYDTVDANLRLGLPVDSREYGLGAQILRELGIGKVRLITNNPRKTQRLSECGIDVVERVALPAQVTEDNINYLDTKRRRLDHLLPEVS